ncbi:MAG: hypothetical protein ACREXU_16335, partial [Gammaproteobacteria bacterium]
GTSRWAGEADYDKGRFRLLKHVSGKADHAALDEEAASLPTGFSASVRAVLLNILNASIQVSNPNRCTSPRLTTAQEPM